MSAPYTPSEANCWLLEGRECECDVDSRCANHDTDAEAEHMQKAGPEVATVALALRERLYPVRIYTDIPTDAYEPGDPKRFEVDA